MQGRFSPFSATIVGVAIAILVGGGQSAAAATLSSSDCQQYGGSAECVAPVWVPGQWVYFNNYEFGTRTISATSPEDYLAQRQALDMQSGMFCSISYSVTQCQDLNGPTSPYPTSFYRQCGYTGSYSYHFVNPDFNVCYDPAPINSTNGIGGEAQGIASCPSGYSQTVGSAYLYPRTYPFLCAKELNPPPPPPPPPPPAQDDGPDTGGPDSPDSTPPQPDTPDALPPSPEPKVQPDQGGGTNTSGSQDCTGASATAGDPINTSNGSKFVTTTDYAPAGSSPLRLIRYYDSRMVADGSFGPHWRHHYDRRLDSVSSTVVKLRRADGKAFTFTLTNGQWTAAGSVNLRLQSLGNGQGWKVITPRDEVELYDAQGRLIQITQRGGLSLSMTYNGAGKLYAVTDSLGWQLTFEYDAQGRVAVVTDPAGKRYVYGYDSAGNLSTRQTPDGRTIRYAYENPSFPHALTAVVDGNNIQTDTTFYDLKGRAYSNERNAGIDKVSIAYGDTAGSGATVTDANNVSQSFTFQLIQGVFKATGLTRSCPTCGTAARSFTRDANGNITSRTDFNGIRTTYQYDLSRNVETSRTEAVGTTVERTIRTEWHPTFHVPVKITAPGRITAMAYDDNGNMTELTVTDTATNESRIWHYRYGTYGLLTGRTLPSGEGISYEYDDQGRLTTATTTAGLVTQYSNYDANGHVGSIVYPSGRTVAFTYDEVGRVLTSAEAVQQGSDGQSWWDQVIEWLRKLFGLSSTAPQAQGDSGTAVTHYLYDNAGLLSDTQLPDGETLHYEYDPAYRVILARDAFGNTIRIIRDPLGRPQTTQVTDASGVLAQTLQRTYDELGRLAALPGNNGQRLTYRYDEEGYLLEQANALAQRTARSRDARYRTTSLTDADSQTTQFDFDPLDHLTGVTDARGNRTAYGRNAFGEAVTEQSPDRGSVARVFESGRLKRVTDARGLSQDFTYDADGRVLSRTSSSSTVTYRYDEGDFGKGHLTHIGDASGSTRYRYTSQGRVAEKTSVINQGPTLAVSYGYTLGGKLKEVATPGKHLIQYGYDDQGRLSGVSVDGQVLLSQVRFGAQGITGWTWADGEQRDERYDQDGRLIQITSGSALARVYGYDTANRLTNLLDTRAGVNDRYGYDAVGRLLSQQSSTLSVSYRYDALGNRTQKQQGGLATNYVYDPAGNRLLSETTSGKTRSYSYLPSGQLSSDGGATYVYNDDGRLVDVGGQRPLHYDYNALGQRVRKVGQGVLVFAYDEAGHLLGEYTPGGVMVREYVWLGNRLVGMLSQQEKNVLYVHTDHLGTPRAVSDAATVLWRWEGEAFGNSSPNEQVAGPSRKFTLPLRFPGQYYDSEAGFSYNYLRDYNPSMGRYLESDPAGLIGGINTYAYVNGNPIGFADPFGLSAIEDFVQHATESGGTIYYNWRPWTGAQPLDSGSGWVLLLGQMDNMGNIINSGAFDPITGEQAGLTDTLSEDQLIDSLTSDEVGSGGSNFNDWLKRNCPSTSPNGSQ